MLQCSWAVLTMAGKMSQPSAFGASKTAQGGVGRPQRVEDALDPGLVVGQGENARRGAREDETEPLQDGRDLGLAVGDAGDLLAPVEDDVVAGIVPVEPRGEAFVFDGEELDAVADRGERVAEGRDVLRASRISCGGPIGADVVEEKNRKVAPSAFNHDPNID